MQCGFEGYTVQMPDASYVMRINRVVDYIDAHLADRLETPGHGVRRRRLEVAAFRLGATPAAPVLRIALEVGFQSAEVFTRAFRAHFGVTPSAWRRGAAGDWAERRKLELRKIHQADRKHHRAAWAAFPQDPNVWPQPVERFNCQLCLPINAV